MPARLDWASAIGNFILNYGALDWHLTVFLEARLPEDEFDAVKDLYFQDRVRRIQKLVENDRAMSVKRTEFGKFFERLEAMRLLRNQIAHGQLTLKLTKELQVEGIVLTQPKDLDSQERTQSRALNFNEMVAAMTELADLLQEFQRLSGDWKEGETLFFGGAQ